MKIPKKISINKDKDIVTFIFDEESFVLDAEFLRVHSPSTESKADGYGNKILEYGKQFVKIDSIKTAGMYAIRFFFSDKHNTGIYTYDYLYQLALSKEKLWDIYLQKLSSQNKFRNPDEQAVKFIC